MLVALTLTALATACSGGEVPSQEDTGPHTTRPVSAESANTAVLALCGIAGETDLATATAAFHDRAHETLHAIAGEVGEVDRAIEAALLTAKSKVEADLEAGSLPPTFGADVTALISATGTALEAIGLPTPPCPA